MSAQVTAQFGQPDPNANPTSISDLITLLNSLSLAENVSGGPFSPYVISPTTPAVADQDKAWLKTDNNGRPLEIRTFYNGNWRRFYNGNTSELRIFRGDPATYFDNTGLGTIGLAWDGWAICNGQNGTDNWSDTFPVFGRMDNTGITGYNNGWQSNVTGAVMKTGGSSAHVIVNNDLPNMTITVTGQKYDPNTNAADDRVIVTNNHSAVTKTDLNPIASFGADPPGTPQTAVPTVPPFKAACLCAFVGYS